MPFWASKGLAFFGSRLLRARLPTLFSPLFGLVELTLGRLMEHLEKVHDPLEGSDPCTNQKAQNDAGALDLSPEFVGHAALFLGLEMPRYLSN